MTQQIQAQVQQDNSLLGKISSKIKEKAEKENLSYGSDMITAANYVTQNNIQLEFIDRDILETKRLMELLPQAELQFFMQELAKIESESLNQEIDEKKVVETLKSKTPIASEFLISSRDLFMANRLLKIERANRDKVIIAFVGKGHLKSLGELI